MRRALLRLLRCPSCRRGKLQAESDAADIAFGPLRCSECQNGFPVGEGVVDLVVERSAIPKTQRAFELPWVARSYERYLRSTVERRLFRSRMDSESEYLLYRSMLGRPDGPVLDLGCGTGLIARRLAREPEMPAVVGMDISKPMIEEAVAQAREAGLLLDFVRAEAPELPFLDDTLGAVLQAGTLHFLQDLDRALSEIFRALRPGGRLVASTYVPGFLTQQVHKRAGLYPRSEDALRNAARRAGLIAFERLSTGEQLVFKAEKPQV